jgi:uncharacterized membrane protein YraQ (UPF0718 family)
MNTTAIIINLLALGCLIIALIKDRGRTKQSMGVAAKSFIRILPAVLIIVTIIGILMAFVPPDQISRFIGDQVGFVGVLSIAALGAVLHIPALISFPLARVSYLS